MIEDKPQKRLGIQQFLGKRIIIKAIRGSDGRDWHQPEIPMILLKNVEIVNANLKYDHLWIHGPKNVQGLAGTMEGDKITLSACVIQYQRDHAFRKPDPIKFDYSIKNPIIMSINGNFKGVEECKTCLSLIDCHFNNPYPCEHYREKWQFEQNDYQEANWLYHPQGGGM